MHKLSPWLTATSALFDKLLGSNRLPHAILIDGQEGWGQETLAAHFALRLLNLENKFDELPALHEIAHPDLRWLIPETSIIKVEQIRQLANFVNGTAQSGDRKVGVITQAHKMNAQSANALLKTLEEPAGNTHLILTTHSLHRLLPTVRSRCQRLSISTCSHGETLNWLAEQGVDGQTIEHLMFEFGGAPERVLSAAENSVQPVYLALQTALGGGDVSKLSSDWKDQEATDLLARWYRYLVLALAGEGPFGHLQTKSAKALMSFSEELTATLPYVQNATSVNQQLLFERLLSRWRALAA